MAVVVTAIWVVVIIGALYFGHVAVPRWLRWAGLIFGGLLVWSILLTLARTRRVIGEDIAIRISREALERQGFNVFWNSAEYRKIKGEI